MPITLNDLKTVEAPSFAKAVNEYYFRKNVLVNSGAAIRLTPEDLGINPDHGARLVDIPLLKIDSESHVDLVDTNTTTSAVGIEAGRQVARNLFRGRAWGKSAIAQYMLGKDPLEGLAELIGNFWATNEHKAILHILAGLFGNDGRATSEITARYKDSKSAGIVTESIVKEGLYQMGDQFDRIKLMMVHPDVYKLLDLAQAVVEVQDENLNLYPILRGTGIRIHVDSSMPRHNLSVPNDIGANNSTIYYLGEGAFTISTMFDYLKAEEAASAGEVRVHNRRIYFAHPNGLSWQSAAPTNAAGQDLTPTNAQLATKTNWKKCASIENILIVRQDVAVAQ